MSALCQKRTHAVQQSTLFDHLVGASDERGVGRSGRRSRLRNDAPRYSALEVGRPIRPSMLLWPKPLDLRLERGFDRPVGRLNRDHARSGIGDTASLADALDLRTLLGEFASAQD